MRIIWLAAALAVAHSTGQFYAPTFSDLDNGHFVQDGLPPSAHPDQHVYAHHDHEHIHDHAHGHHAGHEMDDQEPKVVPVIRECKGDMRPEAAKCGCAKKYGLAENLCDAGEFCNIKEGTCMPAEEVTCFIQRAYCCGGGAPDNCDNTTPLRRRLQDQDWQMNTESFPINLQSIAAMTYSSMSLPGSKGSYQGDVAEGIAPLLEAGQGDFAGGAMPMYEDIPLRDDPLSRRRLQSNEVSPWSNQCPSNQEEEPTVFYGEEELSLELSQDQKWLKFSFMDQGRGTLLTIEGRRNCKFPVCMTQKVTYEMGPDDDAPNDNDKVYGPGQFTMTEDEKRNDDEPEMLTVKSPGSGAWLGMSPFNPTSFLALKTATQGFMTAAQAAAFKASYINALANGECPYWSPYYTTLGISPYLDNNAATCAAADGMESACDYLASLGANCCYRIDTDTCTYNDNCKYTNGMVVSKEYNWLKRVFGDRAPRYAASEDDNGLFSHNDENMSNSRFSQLYPTGNHGDHNHGPTSNAPNGNDSDRRML